jgi:hypothetical protein
MNDASRIVTVNDKKSERLFLDVPKHVYRNDSNWIPHLRQDIQKIFDPNQNKLLKEGHECRWVRVDNTGKAIGRIAAFIHPKQAYDFDQPTGGMGFFESDNDSAMAHELLDLAVFWLKERGMEAIDGPVNFGDKNQFWGLLVENFKSPNSYGMNYNPPYYQTLLEDYGFLTYYEQFVYHRAVNMPVKEVFRRKAASVLTNYNVQVRDCRGRSIEQIAADFRDVYNGAWGGHDNFKEMSASASMKVAKALKPVMDPEIIVFAYHKEEPIGFYVNIPELNQIFCHVNGNLNWIGKLKFLYHKWKKTPTTMVGIVFGVKREWHGKGIEGAIINWFSMEKVPDLGYEDTILTWIGDFNPKMIRVATNLGTTLHRKYITYRFLFDRDAPFERCKIIE